jgi:cytochrome c oxidase subunit 4
MASDSPTPAASPWSQARSKLSELPGDVREYLIIFALLMGLLILTIVAAIPDFGPVINLGIAMAIAILKALLVVLFFMHVKQASQVTWVFAGSAFLWLAIMIALTLSDYATRNHTPGLIKDLPTAAVERTSARDQARPGEHPPAP